MSRTKALDPSTRFVRSLDGEYYKLTEAAEQLGVSDRTLRNFLQGKVGDDPNVLGPSFKVMFGKIPIYLYTKEDITRIREHLQARREVLPNDGRVRSLMGRPSKWTAEQKARRQRLYSAAHYWRRRAVELDGEGDKKGAKAARDRVKAIKKELSEMGNT